MMSVWTRAAGWYSCVVSRMPFSQSELTFLLPDYRTNKETNMRIGVFLVLFQNLPFEAALDKAVAAGVTAVEIGSGGYPGSHHCPVDELLATAEKRKQYLQA